MSISLLYKKHPIVRIAFWVIALYILLLLSIVLILWDDWRNLKRTTAPGTDTLAAPYLLLDLQNQEMLVKLGKVNLRKYSLTFITDSSDINKFIGRLSDSSFATQKIQIVHLLSGAETISKSELNIIAEETGLEGNIIQRYIPKEMVMLTNTAVRMYVQTGCQATKSFLGEQVKDFCWKIWSTFSGRDYLRFRVSEEDGKSLYGLARNYPIIIIK